ncbi:MAG: NAD(P)H-dependent oxidoreductase subunit E, partial [Nitrospirae bacterium]
DILSALSEELSIPIAQIYGVATFYSQFRLKPVGEHIIKVCHGTACHVGGAEQITITLSEMLHVREDETTSDGKFTLQRVACLGCCSLAPVIMVDDKTYGKLNPSILKNIIKRYRDGKEQ